MGEGQMILLNIDIKFSLSEEKSGLYTNNCWRISATLRNQLVMNT